MLRVHKILFPVDFSERSLGAGRYVQAMADHFGSEVVLLHVVEPFTYDSSVLDKMAVRKMELQLSLIHISAMGCSRSFRSSRLHRDFSRRADLANRRNEVKPQAPIHSVCDLIISPISSAFLTTRAPGERTDAVSYTHLDVYKRQI